MKYAKKSLGQNFLTDLNIVNKIINISEIFNKNILEIGPGHGALTDEILKKKPKSLILVEKDELIAKQLKLKYRKNKIIKIFNKDILKFDIEKKIQKNSLIFGNLPYNISSQILAKMINFQIWPPKYSAIIFMFQKELAERIVGKYNTSKYGRLSILTNSRLNIINKFDVSPNCFWPKPKVNSTVIFFKPIKKTPHEIKNISNLEKITNILFSNKRKMINKNIKKIFNNNQINLIKNLDVKKRPQEIEPEKYYEIAEVYEKL